MADLPFPTWDQVTDEHGEITDDSLPRQLVYNADTYYRWMYCLGIASQLSRQPVDSFEARMLANELFESDIPTDGHDELTEGAVHDIKRLKDGTFAPKGLGQILRRGERPPTPRSPGTSEAAKKHRAKVRRTLGLANPRISHYYTSDDSGQLQARTPKNAFLLGTLNYTLRDNPEGDAEVHIDSLETRPSVRRHGIATKLRKELATKFPYYDIVSDSWTKDGAAFSKAFSGDEVAKDKITSGFQRDRSEAEWDEDLVPMWQHFRLTPEPPRSPGVNAPASPGISGMSNPFLGTPLGELFATAERMGLIDQAEPSKTTLRILDGKTTTVGLFAPNAPAESHSSDYLPERQALHDSIVRRLLDGKTPEVDPATRRPARPRASFLAGGTASGKSTYKTGRRDLIGLPPEANTVMIDPDDIKELLPEYQALKDANDAYAAAAVHRESGDIAALAIAKATEAGLHMVVDGTGNHDVGAFAEQISRQHDAGYAVDAIYVDRSTVDSLESMLERARTKKRYVPFIKAAEIHRRVSQNFASVAAMPFVALQVFRDNKLVAERKPGDSEVTVLDNDKFNAFLMKAEEGWNG